MASITTKTQTLDRSEIEAFVPRGNFRTVKAFENLFDDVATTIPSAIEQTVQGPAGGAVDDNVVVFDGVSGTRVKDSGVSIDDLAPLDSPAFTGVPTAPTAIPGTSTTQIATTAFVAGETGDAVDGPASATNNAIALFDGVSGKLIKDSTVLISEVALLASPAFTGNPTAPTATAGDNDTTIATTAFVQAVSGRFLGTQTFTAGGTYTPTSGAVSIIVEVVGGGGAGGGSAATGAGQISGGAGGGAGGYAKGVLAAGGGGAVTVGAGGTGVSGAAGNAGGTSSYGTVSATGGAGGNVGAAGTTTTAAGGAGGVGSGGSIVNLPGGDGGTISVGAASPGVAGTGGSGFMGQGAIALGLAVGSSSLAGVAGKNYGGGGGGGRSGQSVAANAGGNGAPGIVLIHEYT